MAIMASLKIFTNTHLKFFPLKKVAKYPYRLSNFVSYTDASPKKDCCSTQKATAIYFWVLKRIIPYSLPFPSIYQCFVTLVEMFVKIFNECSRSSSKFKLSCKIFSFNYLHIINLWLSCREETLNEINA